MRRRSRRRRPLTILGAGVLAGALVLAGVALERSATPAATPPTTTTTAGNYPAPHVSGFYLDVGASSSLGTQAIPTLTQGYSNDLTSLEAARGVALTLKEVGCPGETSASILLRGNQSRIQLMKSRCYHGGPAQLALASAYLLAHRTQVGVVTIDIGFNDVRPCLLPSTVNQSCFETNLAVIKRDVPQLVSDLLSVAGPKTHFVALEYADPFLQHYLSGLNGQAQAALSLRDIDELNATLVSIYQSRHIALANVPALFHSADTTPTTLKPFGVVPENVKEICQLTWMCTSAHDDHANKQGYEVEASAILAALPAL